MRRPLIGGEDFQASIGQGEQAQKWVMKGLPRAWMVCVFFNPRKQRRRRSVLENTLVLMCEGRLFIGTKCVQTKSMEGNYV
jgi:hypothetical protein